MDQVSEIYCVNISFVDGLLNLIEDDSMKILVNMESESNTMSLRFL